MIPTLVICQVVDTSKKQEKEEGNEKRRQELARKTLNSWTAIQDTYFSTKDIFERHKVVFTIGTSVASVATAWAGYSVRHFHDSKVDKRLEGIENAMKNNHHLEHAEFKKLIDPGRSSVAACIATAGTAFVIGWGRMMESGSRVTKEITYEKMSHVYLNH
ncbi:hypothetical protein OIU84_016742 [Salix udensis]|uniref:Uncharacterized protein n=1 Tax=Salix udensis TaxID=889485 RepID=A0AAD6JBZ9_9ROSI|nr:hypothetical protein OIU84_016742 [Salix udensis]